MDSPRLRIVRREPGPAVTPAGPALVLVLAGLLAGAAGLATTQGADAAREKVPSRELAEKALQRSLEEGSADPEVRETLKRLRRSLAGHPLDARTRVVYASLLLGLCRGLEDTRAAAHHAELAARVSPVTVPVVHPAAVVLARSRERERAVAWVRAMFLYDAGAAAELLASLEPVLFEEQVRAAVADRPEAWLAWHWRLARAGRDEEAERWLREAHGRWPGNPAILQHLAAATLREEGPEALLALLPPGRPLPAGPDGGPLHAYRALARARAGDEVGAREDLARARDLGPGDLAVATIGGDALSALGDWEGARRGWTAALHGLKGGDDASKLALLRRLARLEQEHGRATAALRHWREVLELAPEDPAARRFVEQSGAYPP